MTTITIQTSLSESKKMFNLLNDPDQEPIVQAEIYQTSSTNWDVVIAKNLNFEETEEIVEEMIYSFHNAGLFDVEVFYEFTI
jgi:hypothetical protein